MTDLTNPNNERFRIVTSDETIGGCLGAPSASQGEVTNKTVRATRPPLDLPALRECAEKRRDGMKRVNGVYDNEAVLALFDRAEAAEVKVAAGLAELDRWDTPILSEERNRAGTAGYQRLINGTRAALDGRA